MELKFIFERMYITISVYEKRRTRFLKVHAYVWRIVERKSVQIGIET